MTATKLSFRKLIWSLIRPYWKSEERWKARLLLFVIVALSLGGVYVSVLINYWHNDFYDSLQEKKWDAFIRLLIRFSWLVAIYIAMAVYKTYFNQMLRIKWRRWMTTRYLNHWLFKQNYYRMQVFGANMDNPDQRIAEDIDQFIQLTLGLALEGLSSIVSLFSFLFILWTLSGPLDFTLHGMKIHIPAYMVWVAFVYAFLGTWVTFRIGRPLVKLNFNQQRYEADFRYSLVRLRENSESVAFYKGEVQEEKGFLSRFTFIVENWWQIMRRQKKLNWLILGYSQIGSIFPYVVAAPRYFSGAIMLGGLMQTGSAFGEVQSALSYIINSFTDFASWKAVADRLNGFNASIAQAEETQAPADFHRVITEDGTLKASGLILRLPDGNILLEHIDLALKPGDSLLITGISGSGKSTLLRALSGIWPFVSGTLALPKEARMLFVPQKPYLPLGTLKAVLCYPGSPEVADSALQEILSLCRLGHLKDKLEETGQWSNSLSLGEQQRLAFARVLLAKPDFIFLDEATSALDEATEAQLYSSLKERLKNAVLVSTGHRDSLRKWHSREMALDRDK